MKLAETFGFETDAPSQKSQPLIPGKLRRQVALGISTDSPGSTVTVKGKLEFLKAGSVVRQVPIGVGFNLVDTATRRLCEINTASGFAFNWAQADTADLELVYPMTNGVRLPNSTFAQLYDFGAIDCDAVKVSVESVDNPASAATSGGLAVISTE